MLIQDAWDPSSCFGSNVEFACRSPTAPVEANLWPCFWLFQGANVSSSLSSLNCSGWSGQRSRLFPVAPIGHQRTLQQWLQLQQHLKPQHLKFAGKMNLAKKKLLLPTHPVPTSIDKGCWALHSAFPGNTAEDSTTPSVPPFLKPPHTPHGPEVLLLLTGWHTRTFSAMLSIWWLPQSRTAVSEETKKYFEYWETSQEVNAISALLCHGHCGDCCRCFLDVMLLLFWISSFLWSRELCYTTSLDILFKTFAYSDHYIQTTADFTTWSTSTDPSIPPTTEIPYSMAVSLLSTCHSPSQLWLHFPHCKSYSHILWGLKLFKCWEYFSKKR